MLAQRVGFLGVKIAVHAGPHNALNYAPILIFCISIASSDQGAEDIVARYLISMVVVEILMAC
jgi:hypothetical protein